MTSSSIYDWSLAAADNANADDSINWAEGQPPSSVNNSARAMMQRLREFTADLGGGIIAGGMPNQISIQSNAAVRSLVSGVIIRFRASAANGAKTTLNLNSLGAKPIVKAGLYAPAPLEGGELQAGSLCECVYNAALNNGAGAWFLCSPYFSPPPPASPPVLPAGFIAPFCNINAPAGWLKCNGQWLDKAEFAALFAAIGSRFGGDETRFAVPDLRGEFIRGWADDRAMNMQSGRNFGSWERGMVESHRHQGATDAGGSHSHDYSLYNQGSADGGGWHRGIGGDGRHNEQTGQAGNHNHSFTTDWGMADSGRLGGETRPQNVALLYCIKF